MISQLRRLFGRTKFPPGGRSLPYPVSVARRNFEAEPVPSGVGTEFDAPGALSINKGRMEHLASLGLPLDARSVLDVGCGVGHLAQFFVKRGCRVVCVDAREENLVDLRRRYPGIECHRYLAETDPLSQLGAFDVVFCYGLLYHLENPLAALRNMASACQGLLVLETIVTDCSRPIVGLEDESKSLNQAVAGLGCRPSPSWVTLALNRIGFNHVYAPRTPPDHPDFRFEWRDNLDSSRDGHPIRCIFVASRSPLDNPALVDLLS